METRSFVFVVQGEGRGHLTQAISVYEILVARGFRVHAVMIGSSSRRELPEFFRKKIQVPIIPFQSPNFVTDPRNKSIRVGRSIWKTIRRLSTYRQSVRLIRETMDQYRPDAILNFYEPLVACYARWKRKDPAGRGHDPKIIGIGHQYIYLHPDFAFPEGRLKDRMIIRQYTCLTASGADALLALSFYPLPPAADERLRVLPPLLRKEVFEQEIHQQPFFLAYVLNSGYMQDIIQWHKDHPDPELHCFTDSKAVKGKWRYDDTLCFHSLDDRKFLCMMASCSGLVCTAGFESVCEAMYLGKPALMIPVGGHFEQFCNARDAGKAGAGIHDTSFRIDRLLEYLPQYKVLENYRKWICGAECDVLRAIDGVLPEAGALQLLSQLNVKLTPPSFSSLSATPSSRS